MKANCFFKLSSIIPCIISASGYMANSQSLSNIENNVSYTRFSLPEKGIDKEFSDSFILQKNFPLPSPKKPGQEKIVFRSTTFTYPKNVNHDIGIAYYPPQKLILYARLLKEYANIFYR